MKSDSYLLRRAAALCACLALGAFVSAATPTLRPGAQDGAKDKKEEAKAGPKVSDGEAKLAKKLNDAPDAAAKLAVAEEMLTKFPKTELRGEMISYLPGEIMKVQDAAQRITLTQKFMALFPEQTAADQASPILINAYLLDERAEDAFRVGGAWIEKNPGDVSTLINLTNAGLRQAQVNQNPEFVPRSRQYGVKAIELIEANQRPTQIDEASWSANKTGWLAQLYQSVGYLALIANDTADATARIQKAIQLDARNPNGYALLGQMKNQEYLQIAEQYKAAPAGAEQDALLKRAYAMLDEVIDLYAHAVALSEGNPQMQQFHDAIYKDLESYYRSRHNNSTDGLRQLLDKYKAPSKPQ
jgi:hypothetical protein